MGDFHQGFLEVDVFWMSMPPGSQKEEGSSCDLSPG